MLQPTMAHHKPRAQPQPLPHTPVARCRWGAVSTAESPQAGSVCSPARPTTSPPPRLPLRRQTNSRTPLSLTSVPHSELQTVPPPGLTRGPLPWPPDRTLWKGGLSFCKHRYFADTRAAGTHDDSKCWTSAIRGCAKSCQGKHAPGTKSRCVLCPRLHLWGQCPQEAPYRLGQGYSTASSG